MLIAALAPVAGPACAGAQTLSQARGAAGCVAVSVSHCQRPLFRLRVEELAISPDGRSIYAAMSRSDEDPRSLPNAIVAFSRNARTGALLPAGCLADRGRPGCALTSALGQPGAIAVSPDGRQVYVADARSAAITTLSRDPSDGALAVLGCDAPQPADCAKTSAAPPDFATVAVSPAGDFVARYGGEGAWTILLYRRDPASGRLAPVAAAAAAAVDSPGALTYGPDGGVLYVSSEENIDPPRVHLTMLTADGGQRLACWAQRALDGCGLSHQPASGIVTLAVSADGTTVYTANHWLQTWAAGRGTLRSTSCLAMQPRPGCRIDRIMPAPTDLAVLPNGRAVIGSSHFGDMAGAFARDAATGALRPVRRRRGCVYGRGAEYDSIVDPAGRYDRHPPCRFARGLKFPSAPVISPDSRYAYFPTVQGIVVLRIR